MAASIDASAILALPDAKVVKVSSVTIEDCAQQARAWSLCQGCQAVVLKQLNKTYGMQEVPSFLNKDSTGKGRRTMRGTKKIRLVTNMFKSASDFNKAMKKYSPEHLIRKVKDDLCSVGDTCPLHAQDAWLCSPSSSFSQLDPQARQAVCSIELDTLRKAIEHQKLEACECATCCSWMDCMRDILTGARSASDALHSRLKEFQPALFASLAIGTDFPTFTSNEVCSSCPDDWKLRSAAASGPTPAAMPSTAQPWVASHAGTDTASSLCQAHKAESVSFPVVHTTLFVNPCHALCLMSQAVKTAGRRVGQTPKHTHSGKTAQCGVLELIGLILLARLEGTRRAQLQQQHVEHLAVAAVLHCCAAKLHAVVSAENQKKAQQAIRAAERDAARKTAHTAAQGGGGEDSTSDSEDDFLAAQQDIYLKVKPRDMHSVAQQVASDTLPSHTSAASGRWEQASAAAQETDHGEWQQVSAPQSSVPTISGWNLAPDVPAPAPSTLPTISSAPTQAFPFPQSHAQPSATFHSGLTLPSSQGLAEVPFIPLSTAFAPASGVSLPGAFSATGMDMHATGIHSVGAGGMLGLGSMGATSESSFAVNSALFAHAQEAEAQASKMSQDAQKWAVDE